MPRYSLLSGSPMSPEPVCTKPRWSGCGVGQGLCQHTKRATKEQIKIDSCRPVVHINCSLVTTVKRQVQSDSY